MAPLDEIGQEGHSLNEISTMTGIPYSTLNDELKKNKMQLRPNKSVSPSVVFRQKFKSSAPLPYGFTYMGGQLEKDEISSFAITVVMMAAVAGNLDRLNNWVQVATTKVLWASRASAWGSPRFWPEQDIKNHRNWPLKLLI